MHRINAVTTWLAEYTQSFPQQTRSNCIEAFWLQHRFVNQQWHQRYKQEIVSGTPVRMGPYAAHDWDEVLLRL